MTRKMSAMNQTNDNFASSMVVAPSGINENITDDNYTARFDKPVMTNNF